MLNFNVDPYRDDFDPSKHFHRILFKPGRAVQARELTQSQTILQDQISKFASHLFTQNTPISGGHVTVNANCYYLKLNRTYNDINVDVFDYLNRVIRDASGTILAKVIAVTEENSSGGVVTEPPTLVVSYISGLRFSDSSVIFTADDSNFTAQLISTSSTGKCSTAHISDGVFFVVNGYSYSNVPNPDGTYKKYSIGNFVSVDAQSTILDKYNDAPSLRIGLNITETIYDYVDDVSLLDPALGASNYQAPGADRYVISLDLETRPLTLGDDQGFIELVRLENGQIKKQVDNTVYSVIDDYFAKRTYDTNGDYIVSPFRLTPVANSSNSAQFSISVSKGVAYVRGYRVENQSDLLLPVDRARANTTISRNNISIDYGSYIYLSNVKGSALNNVSNTQNFDPSIFQTIDLHSVDRANVVSANANTYNSTLVATAKLRNFSYDSAANTNNPTTYVYKAFICDIATKVLTSNVKAFTSSTITFYDPNYMFSSKNSAYNGATITLGTGDRVRVTAYDGSTKVATVTPNILGTPNANTKFYINFGVKDAESFAISNTTYALISSADINAKGKVGGVSSGDTLVLDSTYPELLFKIGYPFVKSISTSSYSTQKVFRRKNFYDNSGSAQLDVAFESSLNPVLNFQGKTAPSYLSSDEILNYYTVIVRNRGNNPTLNNGDIIDFTTGSRTVQVSSDGNQVTFIAPDLDALTSTFSVDVIAKVFVNNADDSLILKTKTLINGDTSTARSNTSYTAQVSNTFIHLSYGQVYINNSDLVSPGNKQSLYVCDVKKVVKIIDTLSANVTPTLSMLSDSTYDISSYYVLNNGQTDNYYDHSYLTLRPGAPQPQGNILAVFDYYSHGASGDGYFSAMSYTGENYSEIGNYTAKNGIQYSLRDCLDFRPSRVNATGAFTLRFSTDPTTTDSGVYVPQFLSNFISDYSYYLARKDLVVLSKDNNFQVINGTSALNAVFPAQPDGSLLIGKLSLDPYTAYIPGENPVGTLPNLSVEVVQHKRWTMQDISDLQTRVNVLEQHTNLSLLEQKAQNMQVPDTDGINRYKNGILVDDFSSFAAADTYNPDFSASINKRLTYMTASHKVKNFPIQSTVALRTMGKIATQPTTYKIHNINENTNIFTLPYTTSNVAVQQLASNTVGVNPFNTTSNKGILSINPSMDNWVDIEKAPDLLIIDPSLQVFQESEINNVLNTGDWKTVPGTKATDVSTINNSQNLGAAATSTLSSVSTSTYDPSTLNSLVATHTILNNSLSIDNNYIKDISILPYIRPQEILIKAEGLSINAPITATFDGIDVKNYMFAPDVIEMQGVSGEFNSGDVIGFYDQNVFYPFAIVTDVYVYPSNTSAVRLYVSSNYHTAFSTSFPTTSIRNAFYDTSGNYVSYRGIGNTVGNNIISVHRTGMVSSVGGNFTDFNSASMKYYKVWVGGEYGGFASAYGIWGDPGAGKYNTLGVSTTIPAGKFRFTAPRTGTYYIRWASDSDQYGYVIVDSTTILGGGTTPTYLPIGPSGVASFGGDISISLTQGTHTIEMYVYTTNSSSALDGNKFLALAISTRPWIGNGSYENNKRIPAGNEGELIFSTASIKANTISLSAGSSQIEMPGGGLYYVGATELSLSGVANTTNTFYVGSTITVRSTLVSSDVYGANTITPLYYTSNITAYYANTRTVILDSPVNISKGFNSIVGDLDLTSSYTINGTQSNYSLAKQNGGLARLSTDESGSFSSIFNLPRGMFKAGERVFRIDNRTSTGNPASATTFAEGSFIVSGLSSKSQAQDFSAAPSGTKFTFTRTALNNNLNTTSSVNTSISKNDPIAQTFIIEKANYPNGLFLNSISLFFKSKPASPTTTPINLSIVGTQNGYPNGETLDYSVVSLDPSKVKVSSSPHYLDANTKTIFEFSSPVYIQSGVLYSILLESDSSDYNVFVASQGAEAIPSTVKNKPTDQTPTNITKIGNTPYVGSLFEFQNGATWVANATKSLMMVIDRCVFSTSTATIPFTIPTNLPFRKSFSNEIRYFLDPNSASGLGRYFAATDTKSDAYNITTTDLVPTATKIDYSYISTLDSTKSSASEVSISPGKFGCPTPEDIYLSDGQGERILLANSNSSFALNCVLSTTDNTVSPVISDDGLALYNIEWNINNLGISASQLRIISSGSGYSSNTSNTTVTISSNYITGGTQATANAVIDSSGKLTSIIVTNPGSGYLTAPTISINGANTSPANCYFLSEFSSSGGNADCKYFTKRVVLTPGNDSQDLRVFYTAYRPLGTEIYVFYKVVSSHDPANFDDNNWQLMTTVGSNRNSYSKNRNDIYEYEAAPGSNGVANNSVSYVGTNGQTYKDFIQFSIKVVLTTSDKTLIPFLGDLRAMALPSNVGI
jgi:hypothetical protein